MVCIKIAKIQTMLLKVSFYGPPKTTIVKNHDSGILLINVLHIFNFHFPSLEFQIVKVKRLYFYLL